MSGLRTRPKYKHTEWDSWTRINWAFYNNGSDKCCCALRRLSSVPTVKFVCSSKMSFSQAAPENSVATARYNYMTTQLQQPLSTKISKDKHASAEFYEPAINLLQWCAGNNGGDCLETHLLFVCPLLTYFDIHVSGCCLIFTRLIFNVISSLGSVS